MASKKYYAVFKGRKTGIFLSWLECEAQIKGFSGALYKSFPTRNEAEEALESAQQNLKFPQKFQKAKFSKTTTTTFSDNIILESVCVDASCLGNPGPVEYKGVYTATGEVMFHKSPIPNGTNNLGEFLAIVHALALLKNQGQDIPIYSDSATAIGWVKNKKVRTKLTRDEKSEEIFNLVDRALNWLESNHYMNPLLKWNTTSWGEIPADFGRK